ncbi:class I SAM-dependent methyltransferase [Candidatus Kaiserbacteria bacterium]|nr:class I SAM-dependent methyltransferase [Candidatus Kaiserbacteria bacterium]
MREGERAVQPKRHDVAAHWDPGPDMAGPIYAMLNTSGVDAIDELGEKLKHIAEIDHFHGGSDETTEILRLMMNIPPSYDLHGLDVGCGVGGPMRWFAHKTGAKMEGVDITSDFVAIANGISNRLGMQGACTAQEGDATNLPYPGASFDFATMMAVSPNVIDRPKLYQSIERVIKPGGIIGMLDLTQGAGGPPIFPAPWSIDGSPKTSLLLTHEDTVAEAGKAGLTLSDTRNITPEVLRWFQKEQKELKVGRRVGREQYLGRYQEMVDNQIRNLSEDRVRFECLVFRKQ